MPNKSKGKKTIYLSGAIDIRVDGGIGWRRKAGKILTEMGHTVIDPTARRAGSKKFSTYLRILRERNNYASYVPECLAMMKKDLQNVRESDALIVYIPRLAQVCGTICELYEAWRKKIPVYLVHETPVHKTNNWLVTLTITSGCVGKTYKEHRARIFRSLDKLLVHIKENGI